MAFEVFDKPGQFWRGNLHTHSTRSDGALAPEEVSRRYRAMGYDFYALTDHFLEHYDFPMTDTREHRTGGFTTLIGAELHAGKTSQDEIWHILAVGLPFDFARTTPEESGPALARRAMEAGAFVAIAHPQWYNLTVEDARTLDFVHAVEIYNYGCQVHSDRPDGFAVLDALLSEGKMLTAVATDDAHFLDEVNDNTDAFGGWVMVKAAANEPDALLAALKAGDFYASQGPEFRGISVEGDHLVVRTSPVDRVLVLGPAARSRHVSGRAMTECRLPLNGFRDSWIRVVATDAAGRRAWSNPAIV